LSAGGTVFLSEWQISGRIKLKFFRKNASSSTKILFQTAVNGKWVFPELKIFFSILFF
jgi:hypothetical protein